MEALVTRAALALALAAAAACGGTPDAANELPFGFLDSPAQGTVVEGGRLAVTGWAMDDNGVEEIRIYVDSRYRASTTLTGARPDVAQTHAAYARGGNTFGWGVELQLDAAPGAHTVMAQAVDSSGATRDIGLATFIVAGK